MATINERVAKILYDNYSDRPDEIPFNEATAGTRNRWQLEAAEIVRTVEDNCIQTLGDAILSYDGRRQETGPGKATK